MGADPVTLTLVATALTAAAAGTQAYGQYQEGQAAADASKYQAQVAKNNALAADYAGQDAKDRGRQAELAQRQRTAQIMGTQRAGAASRGVQIDSGSAADEQVDTAGLGELDALMIRSNAEREALGFYNEAGEFRGESRLRKAAAKSQSRGALLGSTSTLLTGGASVADKWYRVS